MQEAGIPALADLRRHAARAWTRCAPPSGTCCRTPTRWPSRRSRRRRRAPARGGRRRLHRSSARTARSGCAASGSSGWWPRPTSRTRSRPSASSASSCGWGSTGRCARPASAPATASGSAADGAGVGAARGRRVTDGVVRARGRSRPRRRWCRGRSGSSAARSTRSTTGTSAIAEEAREALGLERVLLVPASTPPHKPGRPVTAAGAPARDGGAGDRRQPGVRGEPHRARSRRGLVHGGHARTRCAPRASRTPGSSSRPRRSPGSRRGASRSGSSSCAGSPWCRAAGIAPLDRAWVARAGFPAARTGSRFLPGPLLPISGSVVRRRAAAGRSVRYLVPDAVARYIADHRALHRPRLEDPDPVTDPAHLRHSPPGRPAGPRHRGAQDGPRAARPRPADRRARGGQEGGRHRAAGPGRARRRWPTRS